MAGPLEVRVLGDLEFATEVMHGIARLFQTGSGSYGDFLQASGVVLLIMLLFSSFKYILDPEKNPYPVKEFVLGIIAWLIFVSPMSPRFDVVLVSQNNPLDIRTADDVPLLASVPAWAASNLFDGLRTLMIDSFSPVDESLINSPDPLGAIIRLHDTLPSYGANTMGATSGIDLVRSIRNYMNDCYIPDQVISNGANSTVHIEELQSSPLAEVLKGIRVDYNGFHTTIYLEEGLVEGAYLSCDDAWQQLNGHMASGAFTNAVVSYYEGVGVTSSALQLVDNLLFGSSTVSPYETMKGRFAQYYIQESLAKNSGILKSPWVSKMQFEAMQQRIYSQAAERSLFLQYSLPIISMFEMFAFYIAPIMMLLASMGGVGLAMLGKYMYLLLFINLWGFVKVFVDFYTYLAVEKAFEYDVGTPFTVDGGPLSFSNFGSTVLEIEGYLGVASAMTAAIPMLAMFLMYGGVHSMLGVMRQMNTSGTGHIDASNAAPRMASPWNDGSAKSGLETHAYNPITSKIEKSLTNTTSGSGYWGSMSVGGSLNQASSEALEQATASVEESTRSLGAAIKDDYQNIERATQSAGYSEDVRTGNSFAIETMSKFVKSLKSVTKGDEDIAHVVAQAYQADFAAGAGLNGPIINVGAKFTDQDRESLAKKLGMTATELSEKARDFGELYKEQVTASRGEEFSMQDTLDNSNVNSYGFTETQSELNSFKESVSQMMKAQDNWGATAAIQRQQDVYLAATSQAVSGELLGQILQVFKDNPEYMSNFEGRSNFSELNGSSAEWLANFLDNNEQFRNASTEEQVFGAASFLMEKLLKNTGESFSQNAVDLAFAADISDVISQNASQNMNPIESGRLLAAWKVLSSELRKMSDQMTESTFKEPIAPPSDDKVPALGVVNEGGAKLKDETTSQLTTTEERLKDEEVDIYSTFIDTQDMVQINSADIKEQIDERSRDIASQFSSAQDRAVYRIDGNLFGNENSDTLAQRTQALIAKSGNQYDFGENPTLLNALLAPNDKNMLNGVPGLEGVNGMINSASITRMFDTAFESENSTVARSISDLMAFNNFLDTNQGQVYLQSLGEEKASELMRHKAAFDQAAIDYDLRDDRAGQLFDMVKVLSEARADGYITDKFGERVINSVYDPTSEPGLFAFEHAGGKAFGYDDTSATMANIVNGKYGVDISEFYSGDTNYARAAMLYGRTDYEGVALALSRDEAQTVYYAGALRENNGVISAFDENKMANGSLDLSGVFARSFNPNSSIEDLNNKRDDLLKIAPMETLRGSDKFAKYAAIATNPSAIIEPLQRFNPDGANVYLTNTAQRIALLASAARDQGLAQPDVDNYRSYLELLNNNASGSPEILSPSSNVGVMMTDRNGLPEQLETSSGTSLSLKSQITNSDNSLVAGIYEDDEGNRYLNNGFHAKVYPIDNNSPISEIGENAGLKVSAKDEGRLSSGSLDVGDSIKLVNPNGTDDNKMVAANIESIYDNGMFQLSTEDGQKFIYPGVGGDIFSIEPAKPSEQTSVVRAGFEQVDIAGIPNSLSGVRHFTDNGASSSYYVGSDYTPSSMPNVTFDNASVGSQAITKQPAPTANAQVSDVAPAQAERPAQPDVATQQPVPTADSVNQAPVADVAAQPAPNAEPAPTTNAQVSDVAPVQAERPAQPDVATQQAAPTAESVNQAPVADVAAQPAPNAEPAPTTNAQVSDVAPAQAERPAQPDVATQQTAPTAESVNQAPVADVAAQPAPNAEPAPKANAQVSDVAPVQAERPAQPDVATQQAAPAAESVNQPSIVDPNASPEFNGVFSSPNDPRAVEIPDYMMSDIYSGDYPDTLEIPGQGEFSYQGSLGEKDNPFGHVWKNDMGDTYVSKSFGSSLRPFHGDLSEMDFNKR